MNRSIALLSMTFLGLGCESENTVKRIDDNNGGVPTYGDVSGRVCDPTGFTWLEGASVYANLADPETGYINEVRTTLSDDSGNWLLTDLLAGDIAQIFVQKGSDLIESHEVTVIKDRLIKLDTPSCFDPRTIKVAVVSGNYDNFDRVLDDMGFTDYSVVDGLNKSELVAFLSDPAAMAEFDLIFFNGGHVEDGVVYDLDAPDNETVALIRQNVEDYVTTGGRLYASDWAYDWVAQIWPSKIDFLGAEAKPDAAQLGTAQLVNAAIADYALNDFLGDADQRMSVDYDLPVWPPIVGTSSTVSVHLTGTIEYRENSVTLAQSSSPLLVSFNVGEGKVVFSTFRLVANNNADTLRMMQYVMFAL